MVNRLPKRGYTKIPNEIIDNLCKINLTPYETRILFYLFRKTYGWHKDTDWISLSQFSKNLGIDRRAVHKRLKSLSSKGIITIFKGDRQHPEYGIEKNYEKWRGLPESITGEGGRDRNDRKESGVIQCDDEMSPVEMINMSSNGILTKENDTKENNTKEKINKMSELISSLTEEKQIPSKHKAIKKRRQLLEEQRRFLLGQEKGS